MAVLITGGYGLIGSTLARMLVEKGEKVWVFDKFTPPSVSKGLRIRSKRSRGIWRISRK